MNVTNDSLVTGCATQGQFLTSPNGDQCSYMICVYGGDSYDAADHKPLMYTRRMPCAPGTYVPTNYKDTKPARNPCVGMDTAACPGRPPLYSLCKTESKPDLPGRFSQIHDNLNSIHI